MGFGLSANYGFGSSAGDPSPAPAQGSDVWGDINKGLDIANRLIGSGGILDQYIFTHQEQATVNAGMAPGTRGGPVASNPTPDPLIQVPVGVQVPQWVWIGGLVFGVGLVWAIARK